MVLIMDTSMLWERYCLIRVCVQYRGGAVPIAWRVMEHGSSSVKFNDYQPLLRRASRLVPKGMEIRFLADRGFADTRLLDYLTQQLHWHYRIRIKSSFWVSTGTQWRQVKDWHLGLGEAVCLHGVRITKGHAYGPVHLALAHDAQSGEYWSVVSDQSTTLQTFAQYAQRFDIEENFLDDKSNGFQLEQSLIRSASALSRLCLVLAITTLLLTVQGQQVVATGQRRRVDCHWHRGCSYFRIGWDWLRAVIHQHWTFFSTLRLSGVPDALPATASRKQAQKSFQREFTVRFYQYAT